MMKKIIIGLAILVVVLAVILLLKPKKDVPVNNVIEQKETEQNIIYKPEFLSDSEKASLNIPLETRVQSLKKGEDGEVEVYKIITNDWDIVSDPASIGSISPRQ